MQYLTWVTSGPRPELDINWRWKFDKTPILPQGITGKSVSEALILESVNPQRDERLFIELHTRKIQVQNMLCTNIVLNVKTKKQFLYTTCCELVFSWNLMNNLSSYFDRVNWFKNESFWHRFTCNFNLPVN